MASQYARLLDGRVLGPNQFCANDMVLDLGAYGRLEVDPRVLVTGGGNLIIETAAVLEEGVWRTILTVPLVPRHRDLDRLHRHYSISGKRARGTRTRRLRGAPGVLLMSPRLSSSTTMRWTEGGARPKNRAMSVSAGDCRFTFV